MVFRRAARTSSSPAAHFAFASTEAGGFSVPKLDLVDVRERLFEKDLNMKEGILLHLLDHGWAIW